MVHLLLCLPLPLAVRCLLPLGAGRLMHLVVLSGYQSADSDAVVWCFSGCELVSGCSWAAMYVGWRLQCGSHQNPLSGGWAWEKFYGWLPSCHSCGVSSWDGEVSRAGLVWSGVSQPEVCSLGERVLCLGSSGLKVTRFDAHDAEDVFKNRDSSIVLLLDTRRRCKAVKDALDDVIYPVTSDDLHSVKGSGIGDFFVL